MIIKDYKFQEFIDNIPFEKKVFLLHGSVNSKIWYFRKLLENKLVGPRALEQMKLHMKGIKAELGQRGPEQGHYPNVVYEQPAYIERGITGNCPIAEKVARSIKEAIAKK
mgnify:CR=1 FL=1